MENTEIVITFDELMSTISNSIESIRSNINNSYIAKQCEIIEIKVNEVRIKKYNMLDTIKGLTNSILKDINNMRHVINQPEEMLPMYDELESQITLIPDVYFK